MSALGACPWGGGCLKMCFLGLQIEIITPAPCWFLQKTGYTAPGTSHCTPLRWHVALGPLGPPCALGCNRKWLGLCQLRQASLEVLNIFCACELPELTPDRRGGLRSKKLKPNPQHPKVDGVTQLAESSLELVSKSSGVVWFKIMQCRFDSNRSTESC